MPACLHAKVRGRCVSGGRLRGVGRGGLEKGARCTRGSRRHMDCAEGCARIKPTGPARAHLVIRPVEASASSLEETLTAVLLQKTGVGRQVGERRATS